MSIARPRARACFICEEEKPPTSGFHRDACCLGNSIRRSHSLATS